MKKLLKKWFPNYFTNKVEFDNITLINNPLRLCIVDEGTTKTFECLGVDEKRGEFLEKETKKAMLDSGDRIKTLISLENAGAIKHINEFYLCTLIMEDEIRKANNPIAGLMEMMMRGKGGPEGPE